MPRRIDDGVHRETVFVFANGGHREVFIGSADWMGRNLDRRVESVVPVLDPVLGEVICADILDTLLEDSQP